MVQIELTVTWILIMVERRLYCSAAETFAVAETLNTPSNAIDSNKVVMAVFEHQAYRQMHLRHILNRKQAVSVMMKNIEVYKQQVTKAKQRGAQLILFPENGLYGNRLERDVLFPYLENIPDPSDSTTSLQLLCPCNQVENDNEVQQQLSCMAVNSGIYVAANIGDKKVCNPSINESSTEANFTEKCPKDGHFQFNTAIVYDNHGCLVARYHKYNLNSAEKQFDKSTLAQPVYFNSPMGRFGLLISNDLLFGDPAMILLNKYRIDHLLLPCAWVDEKPLYHALGFHSGYAIGHRINVLTANLYQPLIGYSGSGLYTHDGEALYTYNEKREELRLVISSLSRYPRRNGYASSALPHSQLTYSQIVQSTATDPRFDAWSLRDHYAFMQLRGLSGRLQSCRHGFCCYLNYNISYLAPGEAYGFGVFTGMHNHQGHYYKQVCLMTRCRIAQHPETCGDGVMTANSTFDYIYMDGTFKSNKNVFPIMLTNNSAGGLNLLSRKEYNFSLQPYPFVYVKEPSRPIITVALFGRNYTRDNDASRNCSALKIVILVGLTVYKLVYHCNL